MFETSAEQTVLDVLACVGAKRRLPRVEKLLLSFQGKYLDPGLTLGECGIVHESRLHVNVSMSSYFDTRRAIESCFLEKSVGGSKGSSFPAQEFCLADLLTKASCQRDPDLHRALALAFKKVSGCRDTSKLVLPVLSFVLHDLCVQAKKRDTWASAQLVSLVPYLTKWVVTMTQSTNICVSRSPCKHCSDILSLVCCSSHNYLASVGEALNEIVSRVALTNLSTFAKFVEQNAKMVEYWYCQKEISRAMENYINSVVDVGERVCEMADSQFRTMEAEATSDSSGMHHKGACHGAINSINDSKSASGVDASLDSAGQPSVDNIIRGPSKGGTLGINQKNPGFRSVTNAVERASMGVADVYSHIRLSSLHGGMIRTRERLCVTLKRMFAVLDRFKFASNVPRLFDLASAAAFESMRKGVVQLEKSLIDVGLHPTTPSVCKIKCLDIVGDDEDRSISEMVNFHCGLRQLETVKNRLRDCMEMSRYKMEVGAYDGLDNEFASLRKRLFDLQSDLGLSARGFLSRVLDPELFDRVVSTWPDFRLFTKGIDESFGKKIVWKKIKALVHKMGNVKGRGRLFKNLVTADTKLSRVAQFLRAHSELLSFSSGVRMDERGPSKCKPRRNCNLIERIQKSGGAMAMMDRIDRVLGLLHSMLSSVVFMKTGKQLDIKAWLDHCDNTKASLGRSKKAGTTTKFCKSEAIEQAVNLVSAAHALWGGRGFARLENGLYRGKGEDDVLCTKPDSPCSDLEAYSVRDNVLFWRVVYQRADVLNAIIHASSLMALDADAPLAFLWSREASHLLHSRTRDQYARRLCEDQIKQHRRCDIIVSRVALLGDSLREVAIVPSANVIRHGVRVRFAEELGEGDGVTRSWFVESARALTNPHNGLWESAVSESGACVPSPGSSVQRDHLNYFKFAGRLCALAVLHRCPIPLRIATHVMKFMMGRPVMGPEELRTADQPLASSLRRLLQESCDNMGLTFTATIENKALGTRTETDLKAGGGDLDVTDANKREYVQLFAKFRLVEQVRAQLEAMRGGFLEILPHRFCEGFAPEHLVGLVAGDGADLCISEWRKHTRYHGYSGKEGVVQWFWNFVSSLGAGDRRELLRFVTSLDSPPMGGFAALQPSFCISRAESKDRLPTAATCFCMLYLPDCSTEAILREKLDAMLEYAKECRAFNLV